MSSLQNGYCYKRPKKVLLYFLVENWLLQNIQPYTYIWGALDPVFLLVV